MDFRLFLEQKSNLWHSSKKDIISSWRMLRQAKIEPQPAPVNQQGTKLYNDCIRITGSQRFIDSVLFRLKELLIYADVPGIKLSIDYHTTEHDNAVESYVCYVCLLTEDNKEADPNIERWRNIKNTPVQPMPIPEDKKGTRFDSDGIRITGKPSFINAVLSRFKDLLAYEDAPGTRLDLEYREILNKFDPKQRAFLCYIHVQQDLKKKMGTKIKLIDNPFKLPKKVAKLDLPT